MAETSNTSSLTDRTLAGLLWMFSGTVGQGIVQIAVVMVLARLLTPFEFGVVGAAGVIISFSRIFSMFGVGPAIVQSRSLTPKSLEVGFTLSVLTSFGVAALVFASAPFFSTFFRMPELVDVMRALSLLFPIQGVAAIPQARLERELRFKALAFVNAATYALGYGGVGVVSAALGAGVWSLVLAQLAHALASTVALLVLVPGSARMAFDTGEARRLLGFGTGFSLALLGNHVAIQADNLVVGRLLGAQALGFYGRAYQLVVTPATLVGGVIDRVLFPAMASIQKEQSRMTTGFSRASAMISLVTLPASAFLVAAAPELVVVLLGSQWTAVVTPFRILAIALFFRTGYKLSDTLVHARGAVYASAWRKWLYAATVAGGAWVGQSWGIGGVAIGVGGALLVHFFVMLGLTLRLAGLPWTAYVRLQVPFWAIAPISFASSWIAGTNARAMDLHPLAVIAVVLLASALPSVVALRMAGDRMGAECLWLVATARRFAINLSSDIRRPAGQR